MSILTSSTRRRLQQLPQIASVWEGDQRPLNAGFPPGLQLNSPTDGECILWVDGSQGVVRAMDVVTPEVGMEAMVRTLLQAMEHPHSARPARPQKIVVRSRELQFFLRGVLQELDIKVDCEPELPLIDEIFQSFEEAAVTRTPPLPTEFSEALAQKAFTLWDDAPWDYLEDHQVIAIHLNTWDIHILYASVMGMLGLEYGILFYRSLDSLKQFRQQVVDKGSPEVLEEAFLSQDCLFLTFAAANDEANEQEDLDLSGLPAAEIEPTYGTIHPLEGLRPLLHEDEAASLSVALEALHRFLRQHRRQLQDSFAARSSRYRIPNPQLQGKTLSVQVTSLPEVAAELAEFESEGEFDAEEMGMSEVVLREDLVPENSHLGLGMIPWQFVDHLRRSGHLHQNGEGEVTSEGDGLPVVIVQTSRPKAKALIQNLDQAGGLKGICFNTGVDPFNGTRYDLEIVQTGNGDLHLFGEFLEDDPSHAAARKKWDRRCQKTGGYCGLVVAMGVTSATRGGLQLRHMLALFEVQAISPVGLGLGPMVRVSRDVGFL